MMLAVRADRAAPPPTVGVRRAVSDTEDDQRSPSSDVRDERARERRGDTLLLAARTGTERRPGARPRRGQTDARRTRSRGLRLSGWFGHREGYGARRGIVAHGSRVLQLQKGCLEPHAYLLDDVAWPGRAVPDCGRDAGCGRASRNGLDATGPGADRGIAAAIGVQDRERIGGARLAVDRRRGCRRGRPASRRSGRRATGSRRGASCPASPASARSRAAPLERVRPAVRERRSAPTAGEVEPIARRAERLLDQARPRRACPSRESSATRRKARLLQRVEPLRRPRHVLKHTDREPSGLDLNHGRVMYHGVHAAVPAGSRHRECRVHGAGCEVQGRECRCVMTSRSSARGRPGRGRRSCSRARRARDDRSTASHPREKPCGGGVTGRALALVADAIDAAGCPRVRHPLRAVHRRRRAADRRWSRSTTDAASTRSEQRAGRRRSRDVRRGAAGGRASAPARVLDRSRVTDVTVDARRRDARRRPAVARRAVVRDRRRRREQPGAAPRRDAVPPRSAVDRDRVLRARRHQRRDRHRADRRSARLHLVVSAPDASGDRHLRAGRRRRRPPARCARRTARMDRRDRGSPTARGSSRTRGRFRR